MSGKLGLAICGNYLEELKFVVNQFDSKNLQAFGIGILCLNKEKQEQKKILEQIQDIRNQVDELHLLIPETCMGCKMTDCQRNCAQCVNYTTCLELFLPKDLLNQLIVEGNYVVTTGWLVNWSAVVQESWKLPGFYAKDYFKNAAKQICVLDTKIHSGYLSFLKEFSDFSGLSYTIKEIGIEFFQLKIENILLNRRQNQEKERIKNANKRVADYTMAFEVIKKISSQSSEQDLVKHISQLFSLLFSPQRITYTPVDGIAMISEFEVHSSIKDVVLPAKNKGIPDYELLKSNKGFKINASYEGELLGYIEIDDIMFSEHIKSYLALINSIASVFGILIYNSRQYGKVLKEKVEILSKSEQSLKLKNEELQFLYVELQASEEEIRSSNEELRATTDELLIINAELEKSKLKAEESDRLKTSFLHNMSHEIRTPLNAILGFSDMLSCNFENKEKLDHFAEIIKKRGHDLLEIIDEILDIAKIESNQMHLHFEICHLGRLFSEIEMFFLEYRKQIKKSHIQFVCNNPFKSNDLIIFTDPIKLKQIFINLINNAFKFTKQGLIEFGLLKDNDDFLIFYVKDTGIGIPKEKNKEVFERFMQAHSDISRLYGGTGLGLSIVKGLVDLLKGHIWLESEEEKGSTFYFTIPLNLADLPKEETENVENTSPQTNALLKVLIVEDDMYNTEYLKEVLSTYNCQIYNTSFGQEAVEIASSKELDVVLMDIRLPDISGYEATRLIKSQKPELVVLAQTAYATPAERDKALGCGCNDFLSKPLKGDTILNKINRFVFHM